MDLTAKMEVRELTMPPNALVQANDLRLVGRRQCCTQCSSPIDPHHLCLGATSTYYRGNVDSTCMNCDFIASAHRFTAHGRVKAWAAYIDTTYATTARPTILFRVYRPVRTSPGDDSPMTFQLIGQNRVQILPSSLSERRTFAQVDVPPHAQITVQPGDVLGWSYPDSSGIITYSYVNVDRQVMLVKARSGPDLRLEVGDVVPIRTLSALRTYSRREYSVQAVLETADDDHTLNTNGRDLFGVTDDGTKYSVFAAPEEDDVDSGDDDDDEAVVDPCAICLRSLSRGATKTTRNCRHTFHRGCLSRWEARSHSDCPLCRSRL